MLLRWSAGVAEQLRRCGGCSRQFNESEEAPEDSSGPTTATATGVGAGADPDVARSNVHMTPALNAALSRPLLLCVASARSRRCRFAEPCGYGSAELCPQLMA